MFDQSADSNPTPICKYILMKRFSAFSKKIKIQTSQQIGWKFDVFIFNDIGALVVEDVYVGHQHPNAAENSLHWLGRERLVNAS